MLTIVLADDSRFFRTIERQFLQKTPAAVEEVDSSDALFVRLRQAVPQLLIMGASLRPLNGLDCCRRIKSDPALRALPVIMVCEHDDPQQPGLARQAGCEAVLVKPLDRQRFLEAGRQFLSEIREHRKPCFLAIGFDWEGAAQRGKCLDISSGGLFLESSLLIPAGTRLRIEFTLPGHAVPVSCHGEVTWHNRRPNLFKAHYPVGFGLKFIDLPEAVGRQLLQLAGR